MNIYESDKLLAEYLLFHYGQPSEILPYDFGPCAALGFPVRCVTDCVDPSTLSADARALDLGAAVGRSTFELARLCRNVIGIDYSERFIDAAEQLRVEGAIEYQRLDEGELCTPMTARVPDQIDRSVVSFEKGDA